MQFAFRLLLLALTALVNPKPIETIPLRFHPAKGTAFDLVLELHMTLSMSIGEISNTTKMKTRMIYHLQVLDVSPDGQSTLKVTYQSTLMEDEDLKLIDYNSADPPAVIPERFRELAALVDQSFILVVSEQGEIADVRGTEEMIASIKKRLAALGGIPAKAQESLPQRYGVEPTKAQWEETLPVFLSSPVHLGQKWDRRVSQTGKSPSTRTTTYELQEADAKTATLGASTKITGTLAGSGQGVIEIDRTDGILRNMDLMEKTEGSADFPMKAEIRTVVSRP